jgi:hypothetical protein
MALGSQPAVADDTGELAQVIPIGPPRSCFTCSNARFPDSDIAGPVTWCTIYDEVIDSEAYAAEDCFTYERCDEGAQPDDLPADFLETR